MNESNPGLNIGDEAVDSVEGALRRVREVLLGASPRRHSFSLISQILIESVFLFLSGIALPQPHQIRALPPLRDSVVAPLPLLFRRLRTPAPHACPHACHPRDPDGPRQGDARGAARPFAFPGCRSRSQAWRLEEFAPPAGGRTAREAGFARHEDEGDACPHVQDAREGGALGGHWNLALIADCLV